MNQHRTPLRLATALLFTAAALPITPLLAQEAQTQAQTPVEITPPPAPTPPAQAQTPPVVDIAPIQTPAPEAVEGDAEEAAAEQAAPARTRRTPARTAARAPRQPHAAARAPAAVAAPAPVAPAPVADAVPAPEPVSAAPLAATPAPAPAPETLPADPAPTTDAGQEEDTAPLLLVGLLALAGIAAAAYLLVRRRRRRLEEDSYRSHPDYYDEPAGAPVAAWPVVTEPEPAPVVAPAPEPVPQVHMPAPVAEASAPAAAAVPVAATILGSSGRPWIELLMRPVRAGVGEDKACVEFELTVDNTGSAPAEDVRISTFMLAGGSRVGSEMEQTLIDRYPAARLPEALNPGEGRCIASSVALPREELHDAILPVVVADARYRLPDGSEGRTSVSFAVGVPWGEELALFDVDNPSGLHEGVEARPLGEPQKA